MEKGVAERRAWSGTAKVTARLRRCQAPPTAAALRTAEAGLPGPEARTPHCEAEAEAEADLWPPLDSEADLGP